jgi:HK97 family phage prohead protease
LPGAEVVDPRPVAIRSIKANDRVDVFGDAGGLVLEPSESLENLGCNRLEHLVTPAWPNVERRSTQTVGEESKRIVGYAIKFHSPSQDLGGFVEQIDRRAVMRSLFPTVDIRALYNHDPTQVLGRTLSGTLKLFADAEGLRCTIIPPDTTVGRDVLTLVERGDVSGMSFAFTVYPHGETWSVRGDGKTVRTITDMEIHEVSVVTFPAYLTTDATVAKRSLEALKSGWRRGQTRGPSQCRRQPWPHRLTASRFAGCRCASARAEADHDPVGARLAARRRPFRHPAR